ncbi:hypothetical protein CR513_27468, partial [Mucuna pruriens]
MGNVESESSYEDSSSSSEVNSSSDSSHDDDDLLIVRRLMNTQVNEDNDSQMENIFHSRCHVKGKLCSIIIDDGSSVNMASLKLVEKLNLLTLLHLRPYKLDEVLCDLVSMEATHILQGTQWLFDRKVTLKPLSPRVMSEDQLKMKIKEEKEQK